MTLVKIIPSYLYQQYSDDENLQALVDAYNIIAQQYLDWFNAVELPIYTGLRGSLLDWVAAGLYGIQRPSLPYGVVPLEGPLNTYTPNQLPLNFSNDAALEYSSEGAIGYFIIGESPIGGTGGGGNSGANNFVTSDDTFKRVITWLFYKGDGNIFNIQWLKRRCERFLKGIDGKNPIGGIQQTYEISVIFGRGRLVQIIILDGTATTGAGAVPNAFMLNSLTPNDPEVDYTGTKGRILKAGIESGVLALPFQFRYQVYG